MLLNNVWLPHCCAQFQFGPYTILFCRSFFLSQFISLSLGARVTICKYIYRFVSQAFHVSAQKTTFWLQIILTELKISTENIQNCLPTLSMHAIAAVLDLIMEARHDSNLNFHQSSMAFTQIHRTIKSNQIKSLHFPVIWLTI